MKLSDIIRTAFANFRVNKMRTFLTVAGVSIGIGAILFLVSLGFGLQRLTEKRLLNLQALSTLTVSPGRSKLITLDDSALERLKKIEHVSGVSGTMSIPARVEFEGRTDSKAVLYGVDPKNIDIEGLKIGIGKVFAEGDELEALMTRKMMESLKMTDEHSIVGKKIKVVVFLEKKRNGQDEVEKAASERGKSGTGSAVVIVATPSTTLRAFGPSATSSASPSASKTPATSGSTEEIELTITGVVDGKQLGGLLVPIATLKSLGVEQYQFVKMQMTDRLFVSDAKKQIEAMGFAVQTIADTLLQVRQIFGVIQIVLGGFGVIALFVASIGMFNTLTISLLERTHDIGIMKAIGATNWDVRRMFLAEAVLMSFFGGFLGVMIGFGFGQLINLVIRLLASAAGGEAVSVFYTPLPFIGMILVFSALTGLITGFYPSYRATKLSPIEALRYE